MASPGNPPYYPQVRRTVQELIQDRSQLDITRFVRRDPKHQFAIGQGSFGDVYGGIYKCKNPGTEETFDMLVVIKVLRGGNADKLEERFNRELACWRSLNHDNVAPLLGFAYIFGDSRPPGLVSKFTRKADMLSYIGNHENQKRRVAQEIASGLKYLHENNVVHGDVKADNVIISDQDIAQLIDFGIAQIADVSGFTTHVERNYRYAAPELMVIDVSVANVRPTVQSDIYSLGILLLQLFHTKGSDKGVPYNHINSNVPLDVRLARRIREGERPQRNKYNRMTDQHWEIICRCWAAEPGARPTAAEVLPKL